MLAVVVGGQGFLGGEVVRALLGRGDEVVVLDHRGSQAEVDRLFGSGAVRAVTADILDRESLVRAFRGADEVYHLAGKVGTSELEGDVEEAIRINIAGAVNVFEAALQVGVPTGFYPSKPNVWLNTYTITKYASEQFARLYSERHPIRICSLRYFNAFGPRQALSPIRKIIPAFAAQAMRGRPLVVFGDGEQTVDMIYSTDLGTITVDFVRSGYQGDAMDCGRGVAMTVNAVAEAVNQFFGNNAGTVHRPMRNGETPGTTLVADTSPLHRLLGKLTFTSWEDSLTHTLEWYRSCEPREIDAALSVYGLS